MEPLAQLPAIVAAFDDDVDLLVQILSHVARPQVARRAVEGHPPDVANAVTPDLAASAFLADERIVLGDGIGQALVLVVDVDPQDFTPQLA
jgi:hypothetical protein